VIPLTPRIDLYSQICYIIRLMGNVEKNRSVAMRGVDRSFKHSFQLQKAGERYHAGRETGPRTIAASFAQMQVADFMRKVKAVGVDVVDPLDEEKLEEAIRGIENLKLRERFRKHGKLVWESVTKLHPPLAEFSGVLIWKSSDPEKPLSLEYQYIIK
jgi:hypothetical protein